MSLGIAIQHARAVSRDDRQIRTDHAGFIGVVTKARWPKQARAGDFIELRLDDPDTFESHPTLPFFDPATRVAVRSFFANGGVRVTLYGLCISGERDLVDPARVQSRFAGLLDRLMADEDVCLLSMPPLAWLPARWRGGQAEVAATGAVRELLIHCQRFGNRFLVIDAPKGAPSDLVAAWVDQLRKERDLDPAFGAVYYPWLMRGDTALPPSGAILGVYARVDLENPPFGVRVPPANVEVRGFTHAADPLGWKEGARLVELGVNPVLEQAGRGLVVWGARTMSRDPRWQQVTARRIVSFVTERVRRDAEWVVFEHQRPELWETVARMVRSRLDSFWTAGLLTGASAGSEYMVQCDEETNPPAIRDAGQVHVRVQLRPVQATEFIEVELQLGA